MVSNSNVAVMYPVNVTKQLLTRIITDQEDIIFAVGIHKGKNVWISESILTVYTESGRETWLFQNQYNGVKFLYILVILS